MNDDRPREMFALFRDLSRNLGFFQRLNVHCNGVTFIQFTILDFVHSSKGSSMELADLHALLMVDKTTTTRLIEPLLERRMLHRTASKRDARAVLVTLTEKGRDAHAEYWKCISRNIFSMLEGISEDKWRTIRHGTALFAHGLRRLAEKTAEAEACCTGQAPPQIHSQGTIL